MAETALTKATPDVAATFIPRAESIWASDAAMRTAVEMAKYLAQARIIPQAYQNNPGDCLVAIDLGRQMGLSPIVVMQNSQVVYGNFSWKGSACKALIDGCGRFQNSRYETCGKPGTPQWGCRLVAESRKLHTTICGPWVTMQMAQAEGWLGKNGSKWKTMPELMMRYRAASFFARTECPEVLMGFQTSEEIIDITPVDTPKKETAEAPVMPDAPVQEQPSEPEPEFEGQVGLDEL